MPILCLLVLCGWIVLLIRCSTQFTAPDVLGLCETQMDILELIDTWSGQKTNNTRTEPETTPIPDRCLVGPEPYKSPWPYPSEGMPPESPWTFELSRVLTQAKAVDYLQPYAEARPSHYSIETGDASSFVVIEVAARSNHPQLVEGCPFEVFVVDNMDEAYPATTGLGYSACDGKGPVIVGGRLRILAYANLPQGRQATSVRVQSTDGAVQKTFSTSEASPVNYALRDTPLLEPQGEGDVVFNRQEQLDVPHKYVLTLTYDFGSGYFLDSASPGSWGSQLFIPTTVKNVSDSDLLMPKLDWGFYIVSVEGIDSNGNLSVPGPAADAMPNLHNEPTEVIPPGQIAGYDVRFTYWPAPVSDIEWLWLSITRYDGCYAGHQWSGDHIMYINPKVLGVFDPERPLDPAAIEWYADPPHPPRPGS